ncbi:MAG: hypothetical protein EA422_09225 [Gemmatimonadales bacterium]|nr:MAG: hypothetical protein EA422_09225 [Gemmatimonadales bacterium]
MRGLPAFLTRNWTLKLSAFGIALLVWVAVRAEAPSRQTVPNVPVRVTLADPEWALVGNPSPAEVVVRFGGPSRDLLRMSVDRPTILIPLNQVVSEDTTVVLRPEWVRVHDRTDIVVEEIQPSSVTLSLEPIVRLDLPPALRLEGELPDGLALRANPTIRERELRVSGPRSRVAELDSIRLQPVDLGEVQESGPVTVSIDRNRLEGLQVQPERVQVEFQVEEAQVLVLEEVPITLAQSGWDEQWELSDTVAEVTLTGAPSVLDALNRGQVALQVTLDPADLPDTAGESRRAELELRGVSPLVRAEWAPQEVTVTRREEPDDDPGSGS